MQLWTLADAEVTEYGSTFLHPFIKPGDEVVLPSGEYGTFVVTITEAGIRCDCGKGVLCPLNPQTRK